MSKSQTIKINFFGTNDFGAGILEALIEDNDFEIETVFTMPDRPVGRHQELQKSPVKILAEKHGLKITQPESLKSYKLKAISYKLNIVCDYGLIIPKNILESPEHGSINIHPSLLPKYRGATPIQSAIINGETETGVSIMLMDEKMDHGPILAQKTLKIDQNDTYTTLAQKLLKMAKILSVDAIRKWVLGPKPAPQAQVDAEAVFCKEFKKDDGKIDWNKSAQEIYNQWRGMEKWPGVWTTLVGKRLKILKQIMQSKQIRQIKPGEVMVENGKIFVGCGDNNLIEILELQMEGKRTMNAKEFLAGNKIGSVILGK